MPLNKQVYCYSIDTSAFYEEKELYYHKRLLKLYSIRANYKKQKKKNGKRIKKAPEYTWRRESLTRSSSKADNFDFSAAITLLIADFFQLNDSFRQVYSGAFLIRLPFFFFLF